VFGRWEGIALFSMAFALFPFPDEQRLQAFVMLAAAALLGAALIAVASTRPARSLNAPRRSRATPASARCSSNALGPAAAAQRRLNGASRRPRP
jgi:hypothetical protein